ncbi:hypothetical protein ACH4MA_14020 [Streptomyces roseolus]
MSRTVGVAGAVDLVEVDEDGFHVGGLEPGAGGRRGVGITAPPRRV